MKLFVRSMLHEDGRGGNGLRGEGEGTGEGGRKGTDSGLLDCSTVERRLLRRVIWRVGEEVFVVEALVIRFISSGETFSTEGYARGGGVEDIIGVELRDGARVDPC